MEARSERKNAHQVEPGIIAILLAKFKTTPIETEIGSGQTADGSFERRLDVDNARSTRLLARSNRPGHVSLHKPQAARPPPRARASTTQRTKRRATSRHWHLIWTGAQSRLSRSTAQRTASPPPGATGHAAQRLPCPVCVQAAYAIKCFGERWCGELTSVRKLSCRGDTRAGVWMP